MEGVLWQFAGKHGFGTANTNHPNILLKFSQNIMKNIIRTNAMAMSSWKRTSK